MDEATHKQLMILGLLDERPMYGQQLREVVEAHHAVFAATLKKPAMYYQLDRLVANGSLTMHAETVEAPGPGLAHGDFAPRERDVYRITDAGRDRFLALLREAVQDYQPTLSVVDVSIFFLSHLPRRERVRLLAERLTRILAAREHLRIEWAAQSDGQREAHRVVNDHTLTLLDAERDWTERTLAAMSRGEETPM